MDQSTEMSWDDVVAALQAGARPEEVVSRAQGLFQAMPPAPPVGAPTEAPPGTARLYREFPGPGGSSVQLCYLRPPLRLLEAAEGGLPSRTGTPRLDGELHFDVLSLFEPRLLAPNPSLTPDALVQPPEPVAPGAPPARPRSAREWAALYPERARAAGNSASAAAEEALQGAPEPGLARVVLSAVVPALAAAEKPGAEPVAGMLAAQAAYAARLEEMPVSKLREVVTGVLQPSAEGPAANAAALAILAAALGTPLT